VASLLLGQGELSVDIPFVGQECGTALRQQDRSAGPVDLRDGRAHLACSAVGVAARTERETQPGMQAPGDVRR
jgi:hypothetical protein